MVRVPKATWTRLLAKVRVVTGAIEKLIDILNNLGLGDRMDRLEEELSHANSEIGRMEDRIVSRIEMRIIRSIEESEKRILSAIDQRKNS